ncbi:MAG: 5-formyltetrahydrofolate cyclo-ligase [Puniceicoccales bacterium]|jgi:5-formyltetrahydrofolate cyclo-ligase|nr:5-formyltetrahydrofolate cyclo-ligase [Puniceicoccales bacterium]
MPTQQETGHMNKAEVRAQMRRRRIEEAQRSPESGAAAAVALLEQLRTLAVWREARRPCVYVATAGEAPTQAILTHCFAAGIAVRIPRVAGEALTLHPVHGLENLVPGAFGLLEPPVDAPDCALQDVDCVLVPGVAFDNGGRRVGRGKGFYDRFLAQIPDVPRIGLAFEWQVLSTVPADLHDERMDWLVTPERVLVCQR